MSDFSNTENLVSMISASDFQPEWFVAFPVDRPSWTIAQHCKYLFQTLETNCYWWDEEERNVFPNGQDFFICTNWANLAREYFGEDRAVVKGFSAVDNKSAALSADYEGHDFVVLDGQYIVDGWITGVGLERADRSTPGLYDLKSLEDISEIARLYGDQTTWELSAPQSKTPVI